MASGVPVPAEANVGEVLCDIVTFGNCGKPFGAAPALQGDPTVPVNCSKPVMNGAPQFLSTPQGAAKYPFSASCNSPARPGVMTVRWEGSWTPSETRQDRPNASETLTITGYEPFIPGRAPGGKIFMYWTARCTTDPWLQGGTCHRYGGYVPDDLREAFPDIDGQSFPRTGNMMSPSLRQQLAVQYQQVNQQISGRSNNRQILQNMLIQSQQSQAMVTLPKQVQAMVLVPQTVTPKPDTTMGSIVTVPPKQLDTTVGGIVARPNFSIFSRGVESTDTQPSGQQAEDAQPASAESQAIAAPDEGVDEIVQPVALKLDRPVHVTTVKGDAAVLEPGVYEIEAIFDLDLALAKEGQSTVLLHANPGTHSEAIQRTMALVVPGRSDDEQHLLLLMPDGRSFDARGSTSDVKSRSTEMAVALPNRNLKDAIIQASSQPASGPLPPCQANPYPVGPRLIPVPCSTGVPTIPGTAPVPYLDGSNMLHACLNNNNGVFRVVRPADACVQNGEVKVKWQLAP
jgi:hypothetical protein